MGSYAAFAHVLEMNTLNRWEFVWFDLSIRHNFVQISVWLFFTLIFSGMNWYFTTTLSQKRCWWWPVFHFAFTGTKKKLDIIPVLIDDGYRDNIPRSMSHFYYLDYKRLEKELFWNKLAISLGWKPPNQYWERRVTNSAMDVRPNCVPTPPRTQQLSTEYNLGLMLD